MDVVDVQTVEEQQGVEGYVVTDEQLRDLATQGAADAVGLYATQLHDMMSEQATTGNEVTLGSEQWDYIQTSMAAISATNLLSVCFSAAIFGGLIFGYFVSGWRK